ncbi:MAG: hypothetical protein ISS82_01370 [Nanoarchaeota archaeon]|nr:hypothetical protein [Nanoarchaeota archaeon]
MDFGFPQCLKRETQLFSEFINWYKNLLGGGIMPKKNKKYEEEDEDEDKDSDFDEKDW